MLNDKEEIELEDNILSLIETWLDNQEELTVDDIDKVLAYLSFRGYILVNSRHFKETDKEDISISVICNDVFYLACADAEEIAFNEVLTLYRMVRENPEYGVMKWCILKRNMFPQRVIYDLMNKNNLWDLELKNCNLKSNPTWSNNDTN